MVGVSVKDAEEMLWAVQNGDVDGLENSLNKSCDNYGVTPLLAAIYEGHIGCAQFLLENGAKLGSAPDGSSYIEIAQSDELKRVLHQYAAV
ncbi:hypothetical protein D915_008176 [Fasciola hepatica]|uniref:Uncharacterized protein n=1 Tax=Fasciola hepatica TaxID=6192 RepID=A0A4E0R0P8_FASHE|nr:hypothetical protein D915_008176 [Fasciola hepatica]